VQLVAFVLDICNDCFRRLWQLFQSSVAIVSVVCGDCFRYLWIALCISMDCALYIYGYTTVDLIRNCNVYVFILLHIRGVYFAVHYVCFYAAMQR